MTEETFVAHYRKNEVRLRGFIGRSFGRDVEDLASTTWMHAWKFRHQYDGRAKFYTWLCEIAISAIRVQLRRERVQKRQAILLELTPLVINSAPDRTILENHVLARMRVAKILHPNARNVEVVKLQFVMGFEFGEIAEKTGLCVNTIKSQVRRFQEKL